MINNSYGPLLYSLPLSLADKTYTAEETDDTQPFGKDGVLDQVGACEVGASKEGKASVSHDAIPLNGEDDEVCTLDGPKDFNHPASVETQRAIWIPKDVLGLAQVEAEDMKRKNISASMTNAKMNVKGVVEIQGAPPGEPGLN